MKKLLVLLFLSIIIFLSSCSVKYRIGMSQSEFIQLNKNRVRSITESASYTVYQQGNGTPGSTWFYYFVNGVLAEVNEGERRSDFIFENRLR